MFKRTLLIAAVGASMLAPNGAHAESEVVVSTDEAGDWGREIAPEAAEIGSALGQDLIEASILPDYEEGIFNFIITVTELPAIGGTPEATRYTWNLNAGGVELELDGKYSNYSRGTCDPTAGTCPPPRDPGSTPFVLRGHCGDHETLPLHLCQELAKVSATFDQPEGRIIIPVPISALDPDNDCVDVRTGTGHFGGFLIAMPSAFFSHNAAPYDLMDDFEFAAVNTCPSE